MSSSYSLERVKLREHPLAYADYQAFEDALGWMFKSHAFWLPLVYRQGLDVVAINDDVEGALCEALAPRCRRLVVLAADEAAASSLQATADQAGLVNVEVVCFDWSGEWLIPDSSVDLVVLQRVNSWIEKAGLARADLAGHILDQLVRLLGNDGSFLIVDNNPLNFRCLSKPLSCMSRFRAGKRYLAHAQVVDRMSSAGFRLQAMAGDFVFDRSMYPIPEFLDVRGPGLCGDVVRGRRQSLRRRIINHPRVKEYWPSFLIAGSLAPSMALAGRICAQYAQGDDATRTQGEEPAVVRRMVSGNSGVTVMIMGNVAGYDGDVVLRLATEEQGRETLARNADTLAALREHREVPDLLLRGAMEGFDYSLEACVKGMHVDDLDVEYDRCIEQAADLLLDIQRTTSFRVILEGAEYERLVESEIARLDTFCCGSEKDDLAVIGRYLDSVLRGQEILLVRTHGDFKVGNVLFHADGMPSAIIDWEMSDARGLPLLDILLLVTDVSAREQGMKLPEVFLQELLPGRLRPFLDRLLEQACVRFGIAPALQTGLGMMFWIQYLNRQLEWPYRAHHEIAAAWVSEPLRRMAGMAHVD